MWYKHNTRYIYAVQHAAKGTTFYTLTHTFLSPNLLHLAFLSKEKTAELMIDTQARVKKNIHSLYTSYVDSYCMHAYWINRKTQFTPE